MFAIRGKKHYIANFADFIVIVLLLNLLVRYYWSEHQKTWVRPCLVGSMQNYKWIRTGLLTTMVPIPMIWYRTSWLFRFQKVINLGGLHCRTFTVFSSANFKTEFAQGWIIKEKESKYKLEIKEKESKYKLEMSKLSDKNVLTLLSNGWLPHTK